MAPARLSVVATLAIAVTVAAAATNNPRSIQAADAAPATTDAASYLRNVKPLLQQRCFACHGALKQQAGLRLDTAAAMLRGGDSGPAIVRGDSAKSLLIVRVTAMEKSERMPPEHEGEALSLEQVQTIKSWIDAAAPAPTDERPAADPRSHWAFQPVKRPVPPAPPTGTPAWGHNTIDAFIAAGHRQVGVTPNPESTRSLLLRRLSLDLIGLPPTSAELDAFERDSTPGWYERAVERLLDDPRHGERWARHWMDIWRYSDWWGLGQQLRNSQQHIWHWRDWIIESLNADTPYDEMVRLMLAADELAPNDLGKLRATGFLARNYFLFNRNQWMDDTVEHVGKAFLGLTLNCAKCHDHKYDPVEQTDYYRLRAFFEPYHVRMELIPGESDFEKNGIPRAFDGRPETPTYLFIRGQEKDPDKTRVMSPEVPAVLRFANFPVTPVELPVEAWQPDQRSHVAEAYLAAAQAKREPAQTKAAAARQKLADSRRLLAELQAKAAAEPPRTADTPKTADNPNAVVPNNAPPNALPRGAVAPDKAASITGERLFQDTFATLDKQRWELLGGDWRHDPGQLEQRRDGATRAALRWLVAPPRDFDMTLRFTILGGSQWRSVGIAFDSTAADPTATAVKPDDSEQNVYVSAVSGGSKVQAAFHQGGRWQYPANGAAMRPVELNREYTLRVQVRDTLVNAALNGEPQIAWRSPLARRDGRLLITAFDAIVRFHEVSLATLAPNTALREPIAAPASPAMAAGATPAPAKPTTIADAQRQVDEAEIENRIADLAAAAIDVEIASVERRAEASREARPLPTDRRADTPPARPAARAAAKAERELSVVLARVSVAEAELKRLRSATDKKDAAEKEVAAANQKLTEALKKVEEPSELFTRFVGAKWTPTRFFSSGADDPMVVFHPQSTGRRTALASWIADRRNPLTARVAVNHLWLRHFGEPLVPTVFDFGLKGTPATHPELLDWLAAEFMENGWSMKHMHRLITRSAAYRLASTTAFTSRPGEASADANGIASTSANGDGEKNLSKDPENRWIWRRTPMRLESQAVRDSILSLAGSLDATIGGPTVPQAQQPSSKRRSLYFFHSNNERNLFLTMFDEALVKECYRRDQSIVPQQALALSNSQLVLDAAKPISERILVDIAANDDDAYIRQAFRLLLGTAPNDDEIAASRQALAAWKTLPEGPRGEAAAAQARANLIWVLLNHNDFVTVR
jgi:mono/diheme cytochrome c family protein